MSQAEAQQLAVLESRIEELNEKIDLADESCDHYLVSELTIDLLITYQQQNELVSSI